MSSLDAVVGGAAGDLRSLLVEGSASLVEARSAQELASAACALVRAVLNTPDAFVALGQGGVPEAGEGEASLGAWLSEQSWPIEAEIVSEGSISEGSASEGSVSDDVADGSVSTPRFAVPLRSRAGDAIGALAARREAGLDAGEERALVELGALVAACAGNLARYEEVARSLRLRDAVISTLSHNLRTPLNSLRLGASLLAGPEGGEDAKIADRLERSVLQLAGILDCGVDIVRLDAGTLEISQRREDAGELLVEAWRLASPQADAQGVRLAVEVPQERIWAQADRRRALQVLGPHQQRAPDDSFGGGGHPPCLASGRRPAPEQDSGPGIPEEDQGEAAGRAPPAGHEAAQGVRPLPRTASWRRRAARWGSRDAGEGALRFHFTLPCAEAPQDSAARAPPPACRLEY
ncbi:MAG: HAMP domain-containing sensor histidine kinase [Polyangiaceae bacterium]